MIPKVKIGDKVVDTRYPNCHPMTVHKIDEKTGQVLMGKTDDFVELREWHKVITIRDIRFRAWDKFNACYYYADSIRKLSDFFMRIDLLIASDNSIDIQQYTGLKDKNGKEIYEGDIILTEPGKPMVVSWSKRFASFCLDRDGWMFSHWFGESCEPDQVEIIGNKYENQNLLV